MSNKNKNDDLDLDEDLDLNDLDFDDELDLNDDDLDLDNNDLDFDDELDLDDDDDLDLDDGDLDLDDDDLDDLDDDDLDDDDLDIKKDSKNSKSIDKNYDIDLNLNDPKADNDLSEDLKPDNVVDHFKKSEENKINLTADDDSVRPDNIKENKKVSKMLMGLLSATVLLGGGCGYWYLLNGTSLSDEVEDSYSGDKNERDLKPLVPRKTVVLEKEIPKESVSSGQFIELEKKYTSLLNKVDKDNLQKEKEMRNFEKRISNIKNSKTGVTESEINEIVRNIERKTGQKFIDYEKKFSNLEKNILQNKNNIKKTFKISVGTLKKLNKFQKENEGDIALITEKMMELETLKTDISKETKKLSPEIINKIEKLEKQLLDIDKKEVEQKDLSFPLRIDVKDRQNEVEKQKVEEVVYQKPVTTKKVVAPKSNSVKTRLYTMVGVFKEENSNSVYLRDVLSDGSVATVIDPYSVGDNIEGYGKIISISKDGVIETKNGIVKYK